MKTLNRLLWSGLALGAAMTLAPAIAMAQYSTPVRDVENPEKTPFALEYSCSGVGNASIDCSPLGSVPSGYRFVIETESYYLLVANATYVRPYVAPIVSESPTKHLPVSIPLAQVGVTSAGKPYYANSTPLRLYSEATPQVGVEASGATIAGSFNLFGHLVKK